MTLDNQKINEILGVKEAYKVVDRLEEILLDEETKNQIFTEFLMNEDDLSYDWFVDYFQTEHGDRDKLKQDYTPKCVSRLLNSLLDDGERVADICAGTGGLVINHWSSHDKKHFYYCEEISKRAVLFLVFNLSIRNIDALVFLGNSLENKAECFYKLTSSEKFSKIEVLEDAEGFKDMKFDYIISNPPYSLSWDNKGFENDPRFKGYDMTPKSKADFSFVLHGLYKLDKGKMALILPHGVLFRGSKEEKIRKKLIENNLIESIIGLPENLFLNTGIPVLIMILSKQKKDKDIFFINAEKLCYKDGKINNMSDEHIEKVVHAYKLKENIDKLSKKASFEKVKKNEFNLNIPRYVSTFEPEVPPDMRETLKEIIDIEKEQKETVGELNKMFQELTGFENFEDGKEIKDLIKEWWGAYESKYS